MKLLEEIKNPDKLRKNLAPTFAVLTVIVLTMTVFRTSFMSVKKLFKMNKEARNELSQLEKKSQTLKSLDETEVSDRVLQLEKVFPSEKPVLNLLASLLSLSRQEGVRFGGIELNPGQIDNKGQVEVKRVETEEEEKGKALSQFEIQFEIIGKSEAINSFIKKLEQTGPLMKIESLSLSLGANLNTSLTVTVYYQSPPATLGPITQPVPLLSAQEREILDEISLYRTVEEITASSPVGKQDFFSLP
ncbi:hypothetical protein COT75_00560 [Candidatus Beckwithbacteria bacterium CG10_big_fil_rev_8_21_14_0_10_34_10]|uniref:Type IV pilus assembly protein PilO n=1 Tax=Candidatus Beckwithbacteria bacterium CG10_big_fil_rev_8_21_14_0_10_34_10 TaxID=1974495 RepID=A0A2H0WAI0_9BACT|nr:MAG: hypothetical protein COT75_00560 [Candidatus Beckwithbacteria bacterium CG10_big_fil_rev_8_21_14_0_10_34_10]